MDIAMLFAFFVDFVLHLDKHLAGIIAQYGPLTYLILFLIIFCETGLVFTPFLPGDSLLFAAGAFAAIGSFNLALLFLLLAAAAIIGDNTNYAIGRYVGLALFKKFPRILKKTYLDKTHAFYEKYGTKAIILARFVPIVRTFSPFVAGLGTMRYRKFLIYDLIGGIAWVALFLFGGYFFGNIPLVKNHFTIVILAIIVISFVPVIVEVIKHNISKKQ